METDRAKLRLIRSGAPAGILDECGDLASPLVLPARLDAVRLLSLDAHGRVLDWMS